MITLNLLNENIYVDVNIESSEKDIFKGRFQLFKKECSPFHIRIRIDNDIILCSLHYDLELYKIKKINEFYNNKNRITQITVDEDENILTIDFANDGCLYQFEGKIVKDKKENANGEK